MDSLLTSQQADGSFLRENPANRQYPEWIVRQSAPVPTAGLVGRNLICQKPVDDFGSISSS
jgi:hypothetical protein